MDLHKCITDAVKELVPGSLDRTCLGDAVCRFMQTDVNKISIDHRVFFSRSGRVELTDDCWPLEILVWATARDLHFRKNDCQAIADVVRAAGLEAQEITGWFGTLVRCK